MTKDLIIQLPIPYAVYGINYDIKTLSKLDETNALILLAIVSNIKSNPTNTLKEVLHNFYHLNDNYDEFFDNELNNLIRNKTITSHENELLSLNSYVGNFIINDKVLNLLNNKTGFFGNSEQKQSFSLNLKKGLFINQNYENYNPGDKNLIPYNNELSCSTFIDLNLKINDLYNNQITEYINNKLKNNENLFSLNYKNKTDIDNGNNLIYYKIDCKFKIRINDNYVEIFCDKDLEQKIYDEFYKTKIFYQDLLQLISSQISTKFINLKEISSLDNSLLFIENDNIINKNEIFNLDNHFYCIIDDQMWELFIYKQSISDETNNNAIWTKLYAKIFSIDETKEIINNNLSNTKFIEWIYKDLSLKEIKDFILKSICQNLDIIKINQRIIEENFKECLTYLTKNKIDIEEINELFPKNINEFLIEQITKNKDNFLWLLKQKQINNIILQKLIIKTADFDYDLSQTYLVNSKLEIEIIDKIKDAKLLISDANQLRSNDLDKLYYDLKNQNDILNKLNKDINLSCIKQLIKELDFKTREIEDKLIDKNFNTLTILAQENRQILEQQISEKLPNFKYDPGKGIQQFLNNNIINEILNKQEINTFKELNSFNNKFLHGNKEKESFINDKFEIANNKLKTYKVFLENLRHKVKQYKKEANNKK